MREALSDPQLLGNALPGPSWFLWRTMLIAMQGEPLTPEELEAFEVVTGRKTSPTEPVEEAAFVVGRRGGKDRTMSVLATYLAGCIDYTGTLAKGERGVALCIAPDQRQSRVTLDYVEGCFAGSPILSKLITGRTADTLSLSSAIDIEVRGSNFRRLRGMTAIACIASECAFWFSDEFSANADVEILNAVRPALSTTRGPLVLISSPYARKGELFELWRKHYGPDGDPSILVARGPSRQFNPILSERVVKRALEKDFAVGSSEYLAEWRSDIEALLNREAIEAVTSPGVKERPPLDGGVSYVAFVDMASGGGLDSAALCIGHLEAVNKTKVAVIDCIIERKPKFSPEDVTAEFAEMLKRYRCHRVVGDRWSPGYVAESFARHGITYQPAQKTASENFGELLPHINCGQVDLVNSPRLLSQLCALERRVSRSGGKDNIAAAMGQHDDVAACAAGVVWLCHGGQVNIVAGFDPVVITQRADPVLGLVGHAVNPATVSAMLSPPSGASRFDIPTDW